MRDPRRTVVAGTVSGVPLVLLLMVVLPSSWSLTATWIMFGSGSTALLAWARFRLPSVLATWAAGIGLMTWTVAAIDPGPWYQDIAIQALAGAWFGSLVVLPWLLATAAVRFLLLGADARGRYMSEIHS